MCPACIGTLLLVLGGAGSAGGITAVSLRTLGRRKKRSTSSETPTSRAGNGTRGMAAVRMDGRSSGN
ncbi:MAG TPA: hypothetical protein VFG49_00600 [Dyella sp.]|uniref:hypothetical protein n=1 Tax=Dyella sp. TaxID=1869338 RepID=UPI002D794F66|nr:hypothetical protein [Dyella sp.]HET6552011.1 hypothetical protein [Dyella sp.]